MLRLPECKGQTRTMVLTHDYRCRTPLVPLAHLFNLPFGSLCLYLQETQALSYYYTYPTVSACLCGLFCSKSPFPSVFFFFVFSNASLDTKPAADNCTRWKVSLLLTPILVVPIKCRVLCRIEKSIYHPHMRVGNVFGHVCLSVCLSVQAITFEPLDIETSFLVCRYILTIARSSLSIKVIGSRLRS